MRFNPANTIFICIGIVIGVILSLQIRAQPVTSGSFPLEQIEIQKQLLSNFSAEQENLEKKLGEIEGKLQEAKAIIERRSSTKTQKTLADLKALTGFDTAKGRGISIVLNDHPASSRVAFSATNENFVQATDLRDLVNALFLQDAAAIAINKKRFLPLVTIQPVFDSIFIGNFQMGPPFIIEAIGNPDALIGAVKFIRKDKIQVYYEVINEMEIAPFEGKRSIKYLSPNPL